MSGLRVARIPYLNSAPFYQRLDGAGFELVDMPPRELGQLAAAGSVDAGILSLCDLLRDPVFDTLGRSGISVDSPTAQQRRVRCVHDRIDILLSDVSPNDGECRSAHVAASSARACISAKPSRFRPRHCDGFSAAGLFRPIPIPQIRSLGLASTSTRSPVPTR